MPVEIISLERGDRVLEVQIHTTNVGSHSLLTRESRWEYLLNAVRDALVVIADEAKHDPKEG